MSDDIKKDKKTEELETSEWLYSLDYVLQNSGPERVVELLHQLQYNLKRKTTAVSR